MTDDNREDHARTVAVVLVPLGDDLWGARDPDLVAAALASQLQTTLEFIVAMDPTRAPWAFDVLARLRNAVLATANPTAALRH
jgi:hypothetical protein